MFFVGLLSLVNWFSQKQNTLQPWIFYQVDCNYFSFIPFLSTNRNQVLFSTLKIYLSMVTCKLLFKDGITVSFLLSLSSYFYLLVIAILYIIRCQVYMSKKYKKVFLPNILQHLRPFDIVTWFNMPTNSFIKINVSVLQFSLLCFLLQSTPTRMAPPITKNLTVTTCFCIPRDVFLYFYVMAIKTFYSNNKFELVP